MHNFVHEFTAANLLEAAKTALALLESDSPITTAVWTNRASSLSATDQITRLERIENLKNELLSVRADLVGQLLRDYHYAALYANITRADGKFQIDDRSSSPTIISLVPSGISTEPFTPFTRAESETLRRSFHDVGSFLRFDNPEYYQVNAHYVTQIHRDGSNGWHMRGLENFIGSSPTKFYSNEQGDNAYDLPVGAMGFILPDSAGEKAAWHGSTDDGNHRLVHIVNFTKNPEP